ncbi:uncharacterized protein LOC143298071 [Babylonia areolata]|uniref:uncharacterized protein LOC143298071 n=1 Tax=Babylonia areolata TaxID=304850 RepID=UPI003FD683E7
MQQQQAAAAAAASASILREALTRGHLQYGQPVTTDQFSLGMTVSPAAATATTANSHNGIINSSMMSMGLSPHHQIQQQQQQLQQQQQQLRMSPQAGSFPGDGGNSLMSNVTPQACNGQTAQGLCSNVPLDIDMDNLISVDYDMDQVIKQELHLEGNLDFNFDSITGSAPTSAAAAAAAAASQNIVH